MEIYRAVVHDGKLVDGYDTYDIPEDDWVIDGINKAKEQNAKFFMFHNTAKKPLTTLIFCESVDDLYRLCEANRSHVDMWLSLGVLHGSNSECKETLDEIHSTVGKMNDELRAESESFREGVK